MITRALCALAFAFALSGCATLQGVGQDVQTAGQAIEQEARP
jgi:predicted small secreted protein